MLLALDTLLWDDNAAAGTQAPSLNIAHNWRKGEGEGARGADVLRSRSPSGVLLVLADLRPSAIMFGLHAVPEPTSLTPTSRVRRAASVALRARRMQIWFAPTLQMLAWQGMQTRGAPGLAHP